MSASVFKAISPVQRSQEVREQLLAAIERGDYRPGDRLPSERELGQAFGVSRVSIREAVRGLEAIGLVKTVHGRGSFVSEGPGAQYRSPFASWLMVHRDEVVDLMKVRGALDELAAREAALRGDEAAMNRIRAAQLAFKKAAESDGSSPDELCDLDIAYHLAIANASGSSLLPDLLDELNQHFMVTRTMVFGRPSEIARSLKQHAETVDAILARQPDKAGVAAAQHISATVDALDTIQT